MKTLFSSLFPIHRSLLSFFLFTVHCSSFIVSSSASAGNIDASDKYAWSENFGWHNYAPTHGGVTVHPDGAHGYLSGYAWAQNTGWIKLGAGTGPYANTAADNYGVNMDANGNLSGYAWSEVGGWINFNPTHSQVTINLTTGRFDGYAWSEFSGWIHFKNDSPAYNVRMTSGTLAIAVTPASGTWTLSGPAEYTGATNGTGSLAATSVPTGSYTVSYGRLAGYRRPAEQTKEVTEGGSAEFTGEYIVGQTPVDFGGEGISDLAVYNPLTGQWYIWSPETGVIAWETTLGGPGFSPIPGDYNGDGCVDFAVYSDGFWYAQTLGGTSILDGVAFGGADFSPVAGDYDGDGITDMMVYHEGAGRWYGRTVAGALLMWGTQWGGPGFSAVAGDYNNNGRTDLAVYANGYWFIQTADGDEIVLFGLGWGGTEFTPVPGEYDGDGETDLAVYHEASGMWFIIKLDGTLIAWGVQWGGPGFKAVTGDYNGDGISDLAVYYNGYWFVKTVAGEVLFYGEQWGAEGFEPVGR